MKKQSNLLFVFSDQHRSQSLGCYGNSQVSTPNLDRLAENGIRYDRCISNSPVCVPMRGSMLTGRYAWNHRAISNDLPVDVRTPSIADALNQAGYHTGYIGKWHLGGVPRDKAIPAGERLGFTEWKVANCNHTYDKGYYYDEACIRHEIPGFQSVGETDLAIDFIERASKKDAPWALFLSWSPPHEPFDAIPREYLDRYDENALVLRGNVPDGYPDARNLLRSYYALTTLLDDQFGRLMAALSESGQLDDTLVVYTSDHGDMMCSQNLRNKQLPYEESISVPLVMSWKNQFTPHSVDSRLIGLTDLPVTIAGMLGIDMPGADGCDVRLNPPDEQLIYDLVPCHQSYDRGGWEWIGLRTARWTYARKSDRTCWVLFDNVNDCLQMNNLAEIPEYAGLRQELSDRLDRHLARCGYDFRPWEQMVREDGYLDEWNRSQVYFHYPILK